MNPNSRNPMQTRESRGQPMRFGPAVGGIRVVDATPQLRRQTTQDPYVTEALEQHRRALRDELGIEWSPELAAAQAAMARIEAGRARARRHQQREIETPNLVYLEHLARMLLR